MTYVFRVTNARTGRSIRIVAENTKIPLGIREEARRHVLGTVKAKEIQNQEKRRAKTAKEG